MAIEWIKPTGKTQADIDNESTENAKNEEKELAKKQLADTDPCVLEAVENYLASIGKIDQKIVDERKAARNTLKLEATR